MYSDDPVKFFLKPCKAWEEGMGDASLLAAELQSVELESDPAFIQALFPATDRASAAPCQLAQNEGASQIGLCLQSYPLCPVEAASEQLARRATLRTSRLSRLWRRIAAAEMPKTAACSCIIGPFLLHGRDVFVGFIARPASGEWGAGADGTGLGTQAAQAGPGGAGRWIKQ